jgi:hypothetical protein
VSSVRWLGMRMLHAELAVLFSDRQEAQRARRGLLEWGMPENDIRLYHAEEFPSGSSVRPTAQGCRTAGSNPVNNGSAFAAPTRFAPFTRGWANGMNPGLPVGSVQFRGEISSEIG